MNRYPFYRGIAANLPIGLSVAAYGSVLGLLAAQKGIGWAMLLLMNVSVFAGSAQFVMVDMWVPPLPIFEIMAARNALVGMVLGMAVIIVQRRLMG